MALVAALAVTLLVTLWPRASDRGARPAPATPGSRTARTAPAAPPRPAGSTSPAVTTTAVGDDPAALVAAARQALRAWGRFAGSGDLEVVRPHFWPDGPQYQQFQQEAPRLRAQAGPPYSYALQAATVHATGAERVVRGTVVVSRPGERSETVRWDLHLRRDPAGRWRVWTVAAAPAGG